MRVQTAHQTVLQKGMPREILIGLSEEEAKLLIDIVVEYSITHLRATYRTNLANELETQLMKVIS